MKPVTDQTRAWNAGYIIGLEGRGDPCPYTDGPLRNDWYAGFFAGDARAIRQGLRPMPVAHV